MFREVPLDVAAPAIIVFVVAHVVLLLAPRKFDKLFLVAAAFILLSPAAQMSGAGFENAAKYARVYCSFLLVVIGLGRGSLGNLGPASKALILFFGFYWLAALWSNEPLWGVLYKSFCVWTILGSLYLGNCLRNPSDLDRGLRLLTVTACFAAIALFWAYLRAPSASMRLDRLAAMGLNANLIGTTAASLLVLCGYTALYDRSGSWRRFAIFVCGLLALTVVTTGSRASLLMALTGGLVLMWPFRRRVGRIVQTLMLVAVVACLVMTLIEMPPSQRLTTELFKDTRSGLWSKSLRYFWSSPLVGCGWAYTRRLTTGNACGLYVQILLETGIVGFGLFAVSVAAIARRVTSILSSTRHVPRLHCQAALAAALVVAMLVHGIAESALLTGTTLASFALGFGVGMLDRLPAWVRAETVQMRRPLPRTALPATYGSRRGEYVENRHGRGLG